MFRQSESRDSQSQKVINVLANDDDADGDPLTVTFVSDPPNGTAVIDNNRVVYSPDFGFVGVDTCTYVIEDGNGGTGNAVITVTVIPT